MEKIRDKGVTLVSLVMVMGVLAIIVVGIVSYIVNGLLYNLSNIEQEKALYMAQAGVMKGLATYINTGSFTTERNVNVTGEFYYEMGTPASFFLVDASNPKINSKQLRDIHISNLNSTSSITITSMIVTWTFGGNITSVKLGNTFVWNGTAASGTTLTLSPSFTLAPGASFTAQNDQIWRFTNEITGDVKCTFIFSDGSQSTFYLLKGGTSANNEFPITATGEVRSSGSTVARRTLVATYDIGSHNITSWEESQNHIYP